LRPRVSGRGGIFIVHIGLWREFEFLAQHQSVVLFIDYKKAPKMHVFPRDLKVRLARLARG
jgi:hypothetical protein